MAQNETVKFGEPFRDSRGALNLNEGVLTRAQAPDRVPLSPLPPLSGTGYGGWGLDAGRPRGTGGPSPFAQEKGWRTVFGEEFTAVNNIHAEQYAPALEQLPAQINAERAAIEQRQSRELRVSLSSIWHYANNWPRQTCNKGAPSISKSLPWQPASTVPFLFINATTHSPPG